MQFALVDSEKKEAFPGAVGFCPSCDKEMIPKCGDIKIWHWAHKTERNCDDWYENESEWHRNWKLPFGIENVEVLIEKNSKRHIADIFTKSEVVIELQNSPINAKTIQEREEFYGERTLWILNGANYGLIIREGFLDQTSNLIQWDKDTLGTPIWRTTIPKFYLKNEVVNLLSKWGFKRHFSGDFYFAHSSSVEKNYVFHKTKLEQLRSFVESQLNEGMKYGIRTDKEYRFKCIHPHKSWLKSQRPIFIDLGEKYLFYAKDGFGGRMGSGWYVKKESFLKKYC